jgi:hypothetical protein
MRPYFLFALSIILFVVTAANSFGACHAVGPSASGNGSGSDWSNRMNKLPAKLVRGDIYYLMDGSYGSYTFSTPNSGTTRVVIKKAQKYDYGRGSDGCSNDISAGWNASAMGAGQAQFQTFNAQLGLHYVTLDGNGQSSGMGCGRAPSINGPASDCGIFLGPVAYGSIGYAYWGTWNNGATRNNGWTVRYVEGQGGGDANTSSGAQGEDLTCRDGCNDLLWERSYLHDASCDYVKLPWSTGATWRYNFFQRNNSNSTCHGQLLLSEVNADNVIFYSNIIEDITGTSIWSTVTGGQNDGWLIFNNIIERPKGSTRPGPSQGLISCVNAGNTCTNFQFIGNTIVNETDDYGGHLGMMCIEGNPCTATWKNNLYYNTSNIGFNMNGGKLTEDHNTFLNSGNVSNYYSSSTDVIIASGAPDPFKNWAGYDYHLALQQSYLESGAVFASPFNLDAGGAPRPGSNNVWNRGAYQYSGSLNNTPTPPWNLTTSVK